MFLFYKPSESLLKDEVADEQAETNLKHFNALCVCEEKTGATVRAWARAKNSKPSESWTIWKQGYDEGDRDA